MRARSNMSGEWWIADGQALYADGDVGDMNHEAYAIDNARRIVLDALGLEADDEYAELPDEYEDDAGNVVVLDADTIAHVLRHSLSQKEAYDTAMAALDRTDSRNVATRWWGWIRVHGNNVQMWTLTRASLQSLANGIADADDSVEDHEVFDIEVGVGERDSVNDPPYRWFQGVPYWVIEDAKPGSLREYEHRG